MGPGVENETPDRDGQEHRYHGSVPVTRPAVLGGSHAGRGRENVNVSMAGLPIGVPVRTRPRAPRDPLPSSARCEVEGQ